MIKACFLWKKAVYHDKIIVMRWHHRKIIGWGYVIMKLTNEQLKTIYFGAYRFEDECLFIVLKTGQGTEIPPLRADVLMDVIAPGAVFDITRVKFLTESLHEL